MKNLMLLNVLNRFDRYMFCPSTSLLKKKKNLCRNYSPFGHFCLFVFLEHSSMI